jgi:hypothetical protein
MSLEDFIQEPPRFDGPDYEPQYDDSRLTGQIRRVFLLMRDKQYRTLQEISNVTGDPPQLRHLRKKRFGAHTVNKRHRGLRTKGLWEYQLVINDLGLPAYMQKRLYWSEDVVKLVHIVPEYMWRNIDAWLSCRGYRYEGRGVWRKQ